jgi:hypothetical protein
MNELEQSDRVPTGREPLAPHWKWMRFTHRDIDESGRQRTHFVGPGWARQRAARWSRL